jgi:hypothetical protein
MPKEQPQFEPLSMFSDDGYHPKYSIAMIPLTFPPPKLEKAHSIFKNFCTRSPNPMEPKSMHPSSSKSFPKTPITRSEASLFGGSHNYKTKQTTFLHR